MPCPKKKASGMLVWYSIRYPALTGPGRMEYTGVNQVRAFGTLSPQ